MRPQPFFPCGDREAFREKTLKASVLPRLRLDACFLMSDT
jgi:hypothetical protein